MAWPEVLPPIEDQRSSYEVSGWDLVLLAAFFTGLGLYVALCLLEWWL